MTINVDEQNAQNVVTLSVTLVLEHFARVFNKNILGRKQLVEK